MAMQPVGATSRNTVVALPLSTVPEGVSVQDVGSTQVFMVRHGRSVTTYLTNPHGTPGLRVLWFCPTEQLFIEPAHAEAFDVHGRIIGGPAQRGLDALKTTVKDGTVSVSLRDRVPGSTARYDRTLQPNTAGAGPWDTGPQSFCYRPLVAGNRPAASLRLSVPHAPTSPAQPSSHAPDVEQGDPCTTFGATTFNKRGVVFDCEPWADGVNRWIIP
jgi:nitrite reductase/ring-hydroxylating ferredoxin subunit